MALTETQRVNIRAALGYTDFFQSLNTRLESAMDQIGSVPERQALCETYLARISEVDALLVELRDRVGLTNLGKGNLEFDAKLVFSQTRADGRMWVGRLSNLVGVAPLSNIYATGGYAGDAWQSLDFQMSHWG